MVRAATRQAILSKMQDGEAIVLDDLSVTEPDTKSVATVLKALKLKDTSCLLGIKDYDKNLHLSARNIEGLEMFPVSQFNAYTVLRQKRLVLTKAALEELRQKTKPAAEAGAK
jgi:large subunit ribosomal protein L4